jgi:hypothetical protein
VHLDALDQLAAGGAAVAAGAVNALAGGGTLISFPALVGIGVPAVNANVTNTVSLVPGYLSGAWVQRTDLRPQLESGRVLAAAAAAGGLAGSVLLVLLPGDSFRVAVPYLILLACALLVSGDRLRRILTAQAARAAPADTADQAPPAHPDGVDRVGPTGRTPWLMVGAVFAGAVYGGFFGAGLSIMFLAVLGLFSDEPITKLNALKQGLSFVTNMVAALFFAFSGHTVWELVPVMAAGSLLGGLAGGRMVRFVKPSVLRGVVVAAGMAVAGWFLAS